VLVLAGLTTVTFLAEGALLDWSALLITDAGLVGVAQSGVGYMLFAIAMTNRGDYDHWIRWHPRGPCEYRVRREGDGT
jgi:hypothetical protein